MNSVLGLSLFEIVIKSIRNNPPMLRGFLLFAFCLPVDGMVEWFLGFPVSL